MKFSVCLSVALCCLALPAAADSLGPARLIADFAPGSLQILQPASDFARLGSRAVFVALDNDYFPALWVTDGTPQGTSPLGVLCPPCSGIALLGSTGSIAFYRVSQNYPEAWIWRTDGTPRGTFPVTQGFSLQQGASGFVSALAGGRLYFTACTLDLGCEVWSSDGSRPGTASVGEIVPGPESAPIRELVAAGDRAFLIAGDAEGPRNLGLASPHNLTLLKATPQARLLTAAGDGRVFFIAEDDGLEIWTSDGTAAGTRSVTHFGLPDPFQRTYSLTPIDGRVTFPAEEWVIGTELWSVGVEETRRLTDLADFSAAIFSIEKAGNRIVFVASQRQTGAKLWSSRGGLRTTAPLSGCPRGCPSVKSDLARLEDGRFAFYGYDRQGDGFWVTDGFGAGTRLLQRSARPHDYVQVAAAGGRALFAVVNEYEAGELWITDGTGAGTFFVANGGPGWSHYYGWAGSIAAGAASNRLLFRAFDVRLAVDALWSSDGSPAGTGLLIRGQVAKSSFPQGLVPFRDGVLAQDCTAADTGWELRFVRGTETRRLLAFPTDHCYGVAPEATVLDNDVALLLLFRDEGISLWRTDGTPAGTTAIVPAAADGEPEEVTRFGGEAAFWLAMNGPNNGLQAALWLTDGTPAGTRKLFEPPPNVEMYGLTGIGDKLYFFDSERREDVFSYRPWVSDGTPAGTHPLTSAPEAQGSFPPLNQPVFLELGGRVYFRLSIGGGPVEVWSTDGTPAGTSPAITAASGMMAPEGLSLAGGRLYVAARRAGDPSGSLLPWVSDGTDAGTTLLGDVALHDESFALEDRPLFVALNDRVFFAASDPAHGDELWSTDGTPAGTRRVRDIALAALGSSPRGLVVWHGKLYFRARDALHGMELWTSDGSRGGTRLVQDIAAGASWSYPQGLTATEQGLYFSANDGAHGRELWVLPAAELDGEP